MITEFQHLCVSYLANLREIQCHRLTTPELSLRPALDALLKQAAAALCRRPVCFISEAKAIAAGKPDFTATVKELPIGYVEAEAYNVNLDALTGHAKEQNDRFRANLDNFLLTNHLDFRLYSGGTLVDRAALPAPPETGKIMVTSAEAERLEKVFDRFLQGQLPPITSPKELAGHLARRTRQIRAEVLRVLTDPETPAGDVGDQFEALQDVLLPDLSVAQFADLYAQTITYGLFAARCTPSAAPFSRLAAATLIPPTNPFLRKLFQHIAAFELDPRIAWIADDTVQLLANAPMSEILAEFSTRTGKEDPVVHFYETFLAAYDPKVREMRGVYYTPEPVVAYIVRSLDHLLRTRFHKPLGLADEQTLILDPATGTGSFLFAIVRQVHETVCRTYGPGAWRDYVHQKLLPRLFGFELLIAPYAVAHLKLGLLLQELQYTFTAQQRLGVYLTNTLDEALKTSEVLLGKFIVEEAQEAAAIKKERPILVVLGNPPYSGHSANRSEYVEFVPPGNAYTVETEGGIVTRKAGKNGAKVVRKTFIGKLIEDYKQVDGQPLGEQNSKMLQDDYVKFIRFAQWRIARTGEGVIGYVTNHGYLTNPTFRGMRQHLMQTFDTIYVYDLHGNSRKKETAPDGSKDENVFDIQQGVAIVLCLKERGNAHPAEVFHAEAWGAEQRKYEILSQTDVTTTTWQKLQPVSPFYLFTPQDTHLLPEYEHGWKVTDIFAKYSSGLNTLHDDFAIAFTKEALIAILKDAADKSISDDNFKQKYHISDSRDWKLTICRTKLTNRNIDDMVNDITKCLYRPFDERWILLNDIFVGYPRWETTRHFLASNSLGFATTRQTIRSLSVWPSRIPFGQHKIVDPYDRSYIFPIYLYPDEITGQTTIDTERRPNLSPVFLKTLAEKFKLPQTKPHALPQGITPEDIFHYIYAVFHSPTYRARYAEFLKIDFPRLPLTSDLDLFRDLAAFGRQLVALHLLDATAAPVLQMPITLFPVSGDNAVEKIWYDAEARRIYINKRQYFAAAPPEVWAFRVGGYQVCDKWLKDRKGRQLTFDDIRHYQRIIVALAETLTLMAALDERIPGFPLE